MATSFRVALMNGSSGQVLLSWKQDECGLLSNEGHGFSFSCAVNGLRAWLYRLLKNSPL